MALCLSLFPSFCIGKGISGAAFKGACSWKHTREHRPLPGPNLQGSPKPDRNGKRWETRLTCLFVLSPNTSVSVSLLTGFIFVLLALLYLCFSWENRVLDGLPPALPAHCSTRAHCRCRGFPRTPRLRTRVPVPVRSAQVQDQCAGGARTPGTQQAQTKKKAWRIYFTWGFGPQSNILY